MKIKRFLAVTLAATMVINSGILAFADDTDDGHATGDGVVEYDDSVAVEYDKISVPTISGTDNYDFKLDPTHTLHEYEPSTYDDQYSVYFTATTAKANLKKAEAVTKLQYQKKEEVKQAEEDEDTGWAVDGTWTAYNEHLNWVEATPTVPAHLSWDANNIPPLYVWVPDDDATAGAKYTAGDPGKFLQITVANFPDWFEAVDPVHAAAGTYTDGYKLKEDYRIATASKLPIDGRIYENVRKDIAAAGITDSKLDPISDYAKITNDAFEEAVNLIAVQAAGGYDTATEDDVVYTPATVGKVNYSDEVTVINMSTKAKNVSAVVTVKNATGLTFKSEDSYSTTEGGETTYDETASVYFAVDDSSATKTALVAAADGATASVTYTSTLAAKTGGDEITYRTTGTNSKTGGYTYARYEGYDPSYSSNTFKIYATANDNAAAKDAWIAWAKTVTSETRPEIDIVYRVTDATEEEEEEEETVTPTAAFAAVTKIGNSTYLVVKKSETEAFTDLTAGKVTGFTVKLNNDAAVNVGDKMAVYQGQVGCSYVDLKTLLGFTSLSSGDKVTATVVIDGTTYEAVYTAG